MWLASQTRPDVGNEVCTIVRYENTRRESDCRTTISILEYVLSTSAVGNTVQRGSGHQLVAYTDAKYASNAADRR